MWHTIHLARNIYNQNKRYHRFSIPQVKRIRRQVNISQHNNIIIISIFQILRYTLFPVTHHCRSIPVIRSSVHNFQPIRKVNGEKIPILISHVPSKCMGRVTCARQGLGVEVRLGRDIRAIPELLPCESSGCHMRRVSRVYGNFSYTRGTFAV